MNHSNSELDKSCGCSSLRSRRSLSDDNAGETFDQIQRIWKNSCCDFSDRLVCVCFSSI
ncbi:hypothetical protein M6B38_340885 [Iris pallida]|uniref:Uncharacterized protein n=1 Tax=Iris pallida TaxID=29817 RepID=A0AAX6GXT2_IRIPA|nr:hypothetical protein M6B38_340885 [Iris pallida]